MVQIHLSLKDQNKKYTLDFKFEIVNRVLKGELKTEIAAELRVDLGMIFSWVKNIKNYGIMALLQNKEGQRK